MQSWKRGNQHQRQCADLPGETPKQILLNTLKDATVLDLTGCTVDEILYYVSNGYPVFAMTGSNDAVLVVGYDANNVVLFMTRQWGRLISGRLRTQMKCFLMQEIYSLLTKSKKNT